MTDRKYRVVLGVSGSIAAAKSVELARLFAADGHTVTVVQTPDSRWFVPAESFSQATGAPALCEQFDGPVGDAASAAYPHVELADSDLLLIAPATANTIGKMAGGIADNLLLSTYLTFAGRVMVCPAMNHRMWRHPAVQENVKLLKRRGVAVLGPETGRLGCGEEGIGRLAEPLDIFRQAMRLLAGRDESGPMDELGSQSTRDFADEDAASSTRDFAGRHVVVTAGGTREPIDSVRYITNRSSGKMGLALADAAFARGGRVTVIAANVAQSVLTARNPGIDYVDVVTGEDMQSVLHKLQDCYDVLLMAAAVSDYKVSGNGTMGKMQRQDKIDLQLVPTSDIVSSLGRNSRNGLKVGFAAEYGRNELERARQKLVRKDLDIIVFNDISGTDAGFESDDNEITIMFKDRGDVIVSKTSKAECAERILDEVARIFKKQQSRGL